MIQTGRGDLLVNTPATVMFQNGTSELPVSGYDEP